MQHLRNILIDAMAASATSLLKDELQESLDAFSAFERMSTDPMQLIRAVCSSLVVRYDKIPYVRMRIPLAGIQRIPP